MDPAVFVSPHMDDAVLSAGQAIGGWPGATVVTVCTHPPTEGRLDLTEFDRNSGFVTAREACYRRRTEDRNACAKLGASTHHLGLADSQYGDALDPAVVEHFLADALEKIAPRVVVAPMGLVHPDHVDVAVACASLMSKDRYPDIEWWVYEDLPSRVLYPESVQPALRDWWGALAHDIGGSLALGFLGTTPLELKEAAVRCYASQLWALDLHAVLCPERLWRVTR
jgi:LmbE family N-acetylglucosaminyl deacetylase